MQVYGGKMTREQWSPASLKIRATRPKENTISSLSQYGGFLDL